MTPCLLPREVTMATDARGEEQEDKATRAERRERYHGIIESIDANTSLMQLPWIRKTTIVRNRSMAGISYEKTEQGLRAARENGDVIRWDESDDPDEQTLVYCLRRESKLERAVAAVAQRDEVNRELLGMLNQHLAAVREDL